MAIEVMIHRKVQQGRQARDVMPWILQLRALATVQPGYISGRTLVGLESPGDLLVVSTWETIEDWKRWSVSRERTDIDGKIEALSGRPAKYRLYEPIVLQRSGH
ncbi:MAG: antibiotic biosynthesis monooxygenase family protein [Desulfobacterales bacterium]